VVPRNRKDGLRGFFWPRRKYEDPEEAAAAAEAVREALARLTRSG
jgi:histidine triad (HIT) family protein